MAEIRTPRTTETRETSQRVKQWQPASLLPEINKVPGWEYRWIRTATMGQADAMNVSSRMREGWEPVLLADHPELKLYANPDSRFKENIEVGGLLLCKTPTEMVEQRNTYYSQHTKAQADAVDNSFMKENDARMPLFSEKRSKTSFGTGK